MVLSDEEFIAESRDPTPEPTNEIIELSTGTTPTHGILKKPANGNGTTAEKAEEPKEEMKTVPDMQLGRCRYVRLHDNVNYVAAALILRNEGDDTEVLLIQEAKKSCYGKWYMPAGRVEAGETLEESVKREVIEETGYTCDVVELLSLQVQGSGWYRFAFVCRVTGGELKTKPDAESLSAQWFNVKELMKPDRPVKLRGNDFLKLVREALDYRTKAKAEEPKILPINENVPGLLMELMIVRHSLDESRIDVLVHKSIKDEVELAEHEQPFPTVEFGFEYFFAMVISKSYKHLLDEGANVVFAPSHVVKVKCHPKPMESLQHGIRVRLYCEHRKSATKAAIRSPRYHWIQVDNLELRERLHLNKNQYRPSLHML